MNPFTFHIGVDTHLSLSLLFISYTGAMTKDARARQGCRLWLARLTPPIITMKWGEAESLPIFYWTNQLTGVPRCKYTIIFTLNPFMFYVGVDTHLPLFLIYLTQV
jgi:hypothetical protein